MSIFARYLQSGRSSRHDGIVVRASALQSLDLGFNSLVESYQMVSIASLLGARHFLEVVESKPTSSLVVSLGKALHGTPHLRVKDRWPRHFGNSNSQASADIPTKT